MKDTLSTSNPVFNINLHHIQNYKSYAIFIGLPRRNIGYLVLTLIRKIFLITLNFGNIVTFDPISL